MVYNKYLAKIAVLIFAVILVFGVTIWLSEQQRTETPNPSDTSNLVTTEASEVQHLRVIKPISKGTKITSDMLAYRSAPDYVDPPTVFFTDKAEVIGKLAKIDLIPGQLIVPEFVINYSEWKAASTPIIIDKGIYFWTIEGHLQAVDVEKGEEVWQFIPLEVSQYDTLFYSPLTLSEETLYFLAGRVRNAYLYAIDIQTGQEKWRFERVGSFEDISTTAPVIKDKIVYITNNSNELVQAVDANTGREKWQFAPENPMVSNLTISNGIIYFRDVNNTFYAVNAETGTELWRRKLVGP